MRLTCMHRSGACVSLPAPHRPSTALPEVIGLGAAGMRVGLAQKQLMPAAIHATPHQQQQQQS